MKVKFPALFLVGVTCLAGAWSEAKAEDSQVLRTQLAGATLDADLPNLRKFDARQGYYLTRITDGLGRALVTGLYLYPNPKKNSGYVPPRVADFNEIETQKTKLPSIRQGWGVNIGDTTSQVQKKLGCAPNSSSYKRETKSGAYIYEEPITLDIKRENRRVKWQYSAKYIFDKGRVRVIEYEAHETLPEN